MALKHGQCHRSNYFLYFSYIMHMKRFCDAGRARSKDRGRSVLLRFERYGFFRADMEKVTAALGAKRGKWLSSGDGWGAEIVQ
jgi:hypothetical protein